MRAFGNQKLGRSLKYELRGLYDLSGLDAACASFDTSGAAGRQRDANRLKIRIETTTSFIVRV